MEFEKIGNILIFVVENFVDVMMRLEFLMKLVELQLIELPPFHHCSLCCQIPDRGSIFSVRLQESGRFVISPSSS